MTELQQLAMPLSNNQIEAASRFFEKDGWEYKEMGQLRRAFPDCHDAVRVKAMAVNALYGTNIIAITKVGDCVQRVLNRNHSIDPELVEELVVEIRTITKQKNYCFSAKYAHFFIDSDLPILDWYAEWMVAKHLGILQSANPKRYLKFAADIVMLKQVAGLTCNCAELDAYLWVAGEYLIWKANPSTKVNGELKPHFEELAKSPENEPALRSLLGLDVSATT